MTSGIYLEKKGELFYDAGIIRNRESIVRADGCLCAWDFEQIGGT